MLLNRDLAKLADRKAEAGEEVEKTVREILADVKANGDAAVRRYAAKFDRDFEMGEAVSADFRRILVRAKEQIEEFHKNQLGGAWETVKENGVVMGQLVRPLRRVAVYVPGGTAAYPSTVLMNVIPARLAGVPEIAIFTPQPNAVVKAAAEICGVETIYRIGGAQAIAAAAYGTETIPRFDKIVGPGNMFVTTAKRLLYGEVGIDMVAGPSEVLIIADESANPEYVAADLMSQAEHDELASAILVSSSERVIVETEREIRRQINGLKRGGIIARSLENFGAAILVANLDEAFDIANTLAPEHLEILTANPLEQLPKVRNAGSIFLGEHTPEPLGDYMSGANHVLPTGGTARFRSPLGVYDFVKLSSYAYYPREALALFKDDVMRFAELEGLDAHANAIGVRFS